MAKGSPFYRPSGSPVYERRTSPSAVIETAELRSGLLIIEVSVSEIILSTSARSRQPSDVSTPLLFRNGMRKCLHLNVTHPFPTHGRSSPHSVKANHPVNCKQQYEMRVHFPLFPLSNMLGSFACRVKVFWAINRPWISPAPSSTP